MKGKKCLKDGGRSKVIEEAEDRSEEFKRGGKAKKFKRGGKVDGKETEKRLDKKPRKGKFADGGWTGKSFSAAAEEKNRDGFKASGVDREDD